MLYPFQIAAIIFVILVPLFLWRRWEPRIPVCIALGLVTASAITLAMEEASLANNLMIYAFAFLAAGIIILLIRYIRESG